MTKDERELCRAEARAKAMEDALSTAKYAEKTGQTAIEGLELLARVSRQNADAVAEEVIERREARNRTRAEAARRRSVAS